MPHSRSHTAGSAFRAYGGSVTATRPQSTGRNYGSLQTGKWRHEYVFDVPQQGDPSALALGSYFVIENHRFVRTFGGGPDEPPTPTVSNNLAGSNVFNGSHTGQFRKTIRLKNNDTNDSPTLDIYQIALSYYDAHIWDTIRPAECPVTFDLINANELGTVSPKPPAVGIISANDWSNFKFQQHYLKLIKTVTIGNSDGDNVVEFTLDNIPAKCRRSQTGMYWATIVSYDTLKNTSATATLDYSEATSFMETPSEQRLPFIE